MKNIFIAVVILLLAGLAGFLIIAKQPFLKPRAGFLNSYQRFPHNNKLYARQTNLRQATMKINGMWCAGCATGAEYALKEKDGVIDASVDYASETGRVIYDPSKISKSELLNAVKPYSAVLVNDRPLKN
jgi:copper chaperone CopZ